MAGCREHAPERMCMLKQAGATLCCHTQLRLAAIWAAGAFAANEVGPSHYTHAMYLVVYMGSTCTQNWFARPSLAQAGAAGRAGAAPPRIWQHCLHRSACTSVLQRGRAQERQCAYCGRGGGRERGRGETPDIRALTRWEARHTACTVACTPGTLQQIMLSKKATNLHDDLALHASALVGLAVVLVGTGGVELGGHALSGGVQVLLAAEILHVHAGLRSGGGQGRGEAARPHIRSCRRAKGGEGSAGSHACHAQAAARVCAVQDA